jgi:hypothetical protein
MKMAKYHTVVKFPKSDTKMIERETIDAPYTKTHDHSLSWIGSAFQIKRGGDILIYSRNASCALY